jgi:hypothetical protein
MAFNLPVWIKAHKGAAAAIGAGGGAGAYVLWKRKAAAGAASGADGSSAAQPGTDGSLPATATGLQQDPSYGMLEAQIAALQEQLKKLTDAKHPQPKPKPHPRPRSHPIGRIPKPRRRGKGNGHGKTSGPPMRPPHIVRPIPPRKPLGRF